MLLVSIADFTGLIIITLMIYINSHRKTYVFVMDKEETIKF